MKLSLMLMLTVGLLAVGLAGCEAAPAPEAPKKQENAQAPDVPAPAEAQTKAGQTPPATETPQVQPPAPEQNAPAARPGEQKGDLTEESLLHHRFVLKTVDGVDYSTKERVPTLEFTEGFRVAGGICNRFTGQARLEGSTLTVKNMASTKMLCVDQDLNALESTFAVMLDKGAGISLEDRILTLRGNGHELVYELRDLVQ